MAEYIPSNDVIDNAFNPPDMDKKPHSAVYIIQKKFRPTLNGQEKNLYKIGFTRLQRDKVRLNELRTALVSFKLHRLYLYETKDFQGKKGIDDTYAQTVEQHLHNWVLENFKFPVVRIPFPGSVEGRVSPSEWFQVAMKNETAFLDKIDDYVQRQIRPPPRIATAFEPAKKGDFSARRLPKKQQLGVGIVYLDGKPIQKKTFRKTDSKYGSSMSSAEAQLVEKERAQARKAFIDKSKRDAIGSVDEWTEVFVGKTFKDADLGPFLFQFTKVEKNVRNVLDDTMNARKIPAQMAVEYKAIEPLNKNLRNTQGKLAAAQGTLSIHESLMAINAVKENQKSYNYYAALNGYNPNIDYAKMAGGFRATFTKPAIQRTVEIEELLARLRRRVPNFGLSPAEHEEFLDLASRNLRVEGLAADGTVDALLERSQEEIEMALMNLVAGSFDAEDVRDVAYGVVPSDAETLPLENMSDSDEENVILSDLLAQSRNDSLDFSDIPADTPPSDAESVSFEEEKEETDLQEAKTSDEPEPKRPRLDGSGPRPIRTSYAEFEQKGKIEQALRKAYPNRIGNQYDGIMSRAAMKLASGNFSATPERIAEIMKVEPNSLSTDDIESLASDAPGALTVEEVRDRFGDPYYEDELMYGSGIASGVEEKFPVKTGAHFCDLAYRMLQSNRTANLLQIKKELSALAPEIGAWNLVAKHSDKNMVAFSKGRSLAIAHRGTDTSGRRTSRDVASDAALAVGQHHRNREFNKRKNRTIEIINAYPSMEIYLCGHSLGGTTMNYTLEKSGRVRDKVKFARSYNAGASPFAPRVNAKIKQQLDPIVRHHRVEGDVVSASFALNVPFGKVKTIQPRKQSVADFARSTRALDRHALTHFF